MNKEYPTVSRWLQEAKSSAIAANCGMYLLHNGVVRATAKNAAREGKESSPVIGMDFSYDAAAVQKAIEEAQKLPGIYCVRVWLNEGQLRVGDDIMYVLVGGDIRPHVSEALFTLVETLKTRCVTETEITAEK